MRTITAKYTGTCAVTGARILAGDLIDYSGGRAVLIERRGHKVDTITLYDGQRYYQNARGRCIDAPCRGCCDI